MNKNILFVDDEPKILSAYQRQLRKKFHIDIALGGEKALKFIACGGPYAVIISDMKMPGMDGIQLLSKVKKESPETVRIMLTGYADQETAINAVNEGNIFRFLTKPCPSILLVKTIEAGIKQYQLVMAERELLRKTLSGSIKVLTEILSLINPEAFGPATRIKQYIRQIVEELQLPNSWQFEIAAMLSQIGCVTLPIDMIKKTHSGVPLSNEEKEIFANHPKVGSNLLANIPRLELVAKMIAAQQKSIDYEISIADLNEEDIIAFGGRILKLALEFDELVMRGLSVNRSLARLRKRYGRYNSELIDILANLEIAKPNRIVKSIYTRELRINMILDEDIKAENGNLLVSKGQEVTYPVIGHLRSFSRRSKIVEPFRVIITASVISNN